MSYPSRGTLIAQSTTGLLELSPLSFAVAWAVLAAMTIAFALVAVKKARWREVRV